MMIPILNFLINEALLYLVSPYTNKFLKDCVNFYNSLYINVSLTNDD